MTDLVKLLRDEHAELANSREDWLFLLEAADCIEELKAMIPVDYWELHLNLVDFQRKYDALVEGIESAQSHTRETLRLLQWDQLGWDVPEEVIESLGKADSELRALLEDDDE